MAGSMVFRAGLGLLVFSGCIQMLANDDEASTGGTTATTEDVTTTGSGATTSTGQEPPDASTGEGDASVGAETTNGATTTTGLTATTTSDGSTTPLPETTSEPPMTSTGDDTTGVHEPVCGDGVVEGMEPCDDGNQDDKDDCTNACEIAVCGDGIVHADDEQCDNASNNADDAECTSKCMKAVCGDGLLKAGGEVCDDGNTNPGDGCHTCKESRVVFVTSMGWDGQAVGQIAGANAKCNEYAGSLPGDFRAWISAWDKSSNTIDHAASNVGLAGFEGVLVRTDGELFAPSWGELLDGEQLVPLNRDESGGVMPFGALVWTNTNNNGTAIDSNTDCDEWKSKGNSAAGAVGSLDIKHAWTVGALSPCSEPHHLYCFQVSTEGAP